MSAETFSGTFTGTLAHMQTLKVEGNSKPGWSEAFALLGCACDSMPGLESILLVGRTDDESVSAAGEEVLEGAAATWYCLLYQRREAAAASAAASSCGRRSVRMIQRDTGAVELLAAQVVQCASVNQARQPVKESELLHRRT